MKILRNIARPRHFLAGILMAVILLEATPARPASAIATTRYVNGATGADSGDCTVSPCLTIGYAIGQSIDNNIIQIAAGTYAERITVNHNINFQGSGMTTTILDGGGGGPVVGINLGKVVAFNNLTIQHGNAGTQDGGGIQNYGTLSLSNVKVANNTSKNAGGIYSTGALTMTDSVIDGNNANTDTSGTGGGLMLNGANILVTLTRVTISNNTASLSAGGIHNQNDNSVGGSLTLTNVTISGNTAKQNGAMSNTFHALTRVINSTIAGNHYSAGGGNGGIANYAIISFQNTIISGNQDINCLLGGGGSWTSLGNNLDSRNDCAFTTTGDLHNTDPLLGTLADNGGPTPTMALLAGSPAIDAGNDATCAAAVGSPNYGAGGLDQRGVIRPQGPHCDMGAFELLKPLPGAFAKTAPANTANTSTTPTISWGASSGATGYSYCIDTVNNNLCDTSWGSPVTYTSKDLSGLTANTTYYWQVRAVNGGGTTYADSGTWWSFKARTVTFTDVPASYWDWAYIETIYANGITSGCSQIPMMYCPGNPVTREQMAVFILKSEHGSSYTPPAMTGLFTDVPIGYWAGTWIEQLYHEGITAGCSQIPLMYCPAATVTREQMAVFLMKGEHGSSYTPPAMTGVFTDVPIGYWAGTWIEQLYHEGITSGCSQVPLMYCPANPVTRDQMAVFLVKTFHLLWP